MGLELEICAGFGYPSRIFRLLRQVHFCPLTFVHVLSYFEFSQCCYTFLEVLFVVVLCCGMQFIDIFCKASVRASWQSDDALRGTPGYVQDGTRFRNPTIDGGRASLDKKKLNRILFVNPFTCMLYA